MLLSDRQKNFLRETPGIRNLDMLTQLPGSMFSAKIFVRLDRVRDLVVMFVSYEPWMGR